MFVNLSVLTFACFLFGFVIFMAIVRLKGKGLAMRMYVLLYIVGMLSLATGSVWGKANFDLKISGLSLLTAIPLALVVLVFVYRWVVGGIQGRISEVSAATSQLEGVARAQQTASAEVSTSIAEMTTSAGYAVNGASDVSESSQRSVQTGTLGLQYVSELKNLLDGVARVQGTLELIEEIATQTNLLAVNASIEASKAKDHGLGFSVVAQEMRRLSDDTKRATQKVQSVVSGVNAGLESAINAENALLELRSVLEESSDKTMQINAGISQQAAAINQIDGAMRDISSGNSEIFSSVKVLNKYSQSLDVFVSGGKK